MDAGLVRRLQSPGLVKSFTVSLDAGSRATHPPGTAAWGPPSEARGGAAPRPRALGTDPDPIAVGTRAPGSPGQRRPGRPGSRIGTTVGGHRIEKRLGSGGTSVVYRAIDLATGQASAMKVMRRQLVADRDLVERFEQEAVLLSGVHHPGLPAFRGRGHTADGAPYLLMELLDGHSLAERLDIGPMAVDDVLDIASQAATTLDALHRLGIVHCDLKPDNLFLVPDPVIPSRYRVVLIDLGVAMVRSPSAPRTRRDPTGVPPDATESGSRQAVRRRVIGTPPYMAPEQSCAAAPLDQRTDVYGLACLVHEMLCGDTPFVGNVAEVLSAHRCDVPPRASERRDGVPPALDLLLLTMLAKDPTERPPSMAVVRAGLDLARPR
jgi:serine/threonine-protein kinase